MQREFTKALIRCMFRPIKRVPRTHLTGEIRDVHARSSVWLLARHIAPWILLSLLTFLRERLRFALEFPFKFTLGQSSSWKVNYFPNTDARLPYIEIYRKVAARWVPISVENFERSSEKEDAEDRNLIGEELAARRNRRRIRQILVSPD